MKLEDGIWLIEESCVDDKRYCYVAAAVIGAAVVGAASSAVASHQQSQAAKGAANANRQATDEAVREQQYQYDTTREDYAPYREAGANALSRLTRASTGDMSDFYKSPDYGFVRSEGTRDIGNSFAARGGAASGNALRALSEYNQNLAKGQYGDWWTRQQGLVNTGATGTSGTAVAGANSANAISSAYMNQGNALGQNALYSGNARASGIQGVGNAVNQGIGNYQLYNYIQKH